MAFACKDYDISRPAVVDRISDCLSAVDDFDILSVRLRDSGFYIVYDGLRFLRSRII